MSAALVTDTWVDCSTPTMSQKIWPGGWEVAINVPHVSHPGQQMAAIRRWLCAPAVVDDFGNLVLVGLPK